MNIQDFPDEFNSSHINKTLEFIFNQQHKLCLKYGIIERKNGFFYPESGICDLDQPQDQTLLKNMAWRCIEEIGESLEAKSFSLNASGSELVMQELHTLEELADGLHFITELCILSGIDYKDFKDINLMDLNKNLNISKDKILLKFIECIGITMNHLKNKPWKQSMLSTDSIIYKDKLKNCYKIYLSMMLYEMDPLFLLNLYFKKSQVNNFRIKSNY